MPWGLWFFVILVMILGGGVLWWCALMVSRAADPDETAELQREPRRSPHNHTDGIKNP